MEFENIVMRIMNLRGFGMSLSEIHDTIVCKDVTEEMFFMAWHGSIVMEKE